MGKAPRHIPARLPSKLKQIRLELGFDTYEGWIKNLDLDEVPLFRASIQQFEDGRREPPLVVLLKYARLANIDVNVLIDDSLDLPKRR